MVRRFESENVAKRGLCPLYLRGDDRFLPDEAIQEPTSARHHRARHGKTCQLYLCVCKEFCCRVIYHQRWIDGRQRVRNERANLHSEGAGNAVLTCLANHV